MRGEIIQVIYNDIANGEKDTEFQKLFNQIDEKLKDVLSSGELDEILSLLCDIDYKAFFLGANMVLDFISGKEAL